MLFEDENCEQCGVSGKEEQLSYNDDGMLICSECFFCSWIEEK